MRVQLERIVRTWTVPFVPCAPFFGTKPRAAHPGTIRLWQGGAVARNRCGRRLRMAMEVSSQLFYLLSILVAYTNNSNGRCRHELLQWRCLQRFQRGPVDRGSHGTSTVPALYVPWFLLELKALRRASTDTPSAQVAFPCEPSFGLGSVFTTERLSGSCNYRVTFPSGFACPLASAPEGGVPPPVDAPAPAAPELPAKSSWGLFSFLIFMFAMVS